MKYETLQVSDKPYQLC